MIERQALLPEVERIVGNSLDAKQAATELGRALVPKVADLCLIAVRDGSGGLERLTWTAVDDESTKLVAALPTAPADPRARALAERALETGRAQVVADLLRHLTTDRPDAPDLGALTQLAPRGTIVAPLVARGRAFGVITLSMLARSGRQFEAHDTDIAEKLGCLLGVAIENARLFTELHARDQQLRLALATAPVRVFTQDAQLRYTMLSGGELIGQAPALGKTDLELLSPADAAPIVALKRQTLETGIGARRVVQVSTPAGPAFYDLTIEPVYDGASHVVGITGASWDVTGQRRLISQLAEAEDCASRLLEEAPEAYFLRGVDGRYVDANHAACLLLGYSREELLAMDGTELVLPEDLQRLAKVRAENVPGTVSTNEWRVRRKSGELVDIETRTKILSDGRRQGFMRDITDRKNAERERARVQDLAQRHTGRMQILRESTLVISSIEQLTSNGVRSVLQRVVDQARLLVGADYAAIGIGTDPDRPFDPWVWSGLTGDEAAAIGATPRPRGVLGWVARRGEPLRLRELRDHAASRGVPAGHPPMQAFLGVPIVREGEAIGNLYLARKPGHEAFTPEDEAIVGLLSGHAAIAIENARLYDERQAAVRAREDVIAVVSHDLKNPLNAIELRATLLARTQTDPNILAQARSVRRSVAMMQRMIRSLLDGASLDLGQLRLELGTHDLREVVEEVVEVLGPVAREQDVQLEILIPELPPQRFDRERLIQTVYNLAGNAVKYTPAGGSVGIDAVLRDHELVVSVSDTGSGISPEALPRIFDRYFTTAKGGEGTGLGLYIAKGVIEAHGGRIWVDSTLGRGSSFHFTLPAREPTPSAQR